MIRAKVIEHAGEKWVSIEGLKWVIGNEQILRQAINEYIVYMERGDRPHIALQKAIAVVFACATGEVKPDPRPEDMN